MHPDDDQPPTVRRFRTIEDLDAELRQRIERERAYLRRIAEQEAEIVALRNQLERKR